MFFRKKDPKDTTNGTEPENVAKRGIKTMDTVVTGVILGGIIASLYGVKKLRNKNKDSQDPDHDHQ